MIIILIFVVFILDLKIHILDRGVQALGKIVYHMIKSITPFGSFDVEEI